MLADEMKQMNPMKEICALLKPPTSHTLKAGSCMMAPTRLHASRSGVAATGSLTSFRLS